MYRRGRVGCERSASRSAPVWTWTSDKTAGLSFSKTAGDRVHLCDATEGRRLGNPIERRRQRRHRRVLPHFMSDFAVRAPVAVRSLCTAGVRENGGREGDDGFTVAARFQGHCAIRGTARPNL